MRKTMPVPTIKIYGSNDDVKTVTANLDSAYASIGLTKFDDNGSGSTSTTIPGGVVLIYNGPDNTGVFVGLGPVPKDASALKLGDTMTAQDQKLYDLLKPYKTFVLVGAN
jgi:hypothetical protein